MTTEAAVQPSGAFIPIASVLFEGDKTAMAFDTHVYAYFTHNRFGDNYLTELNGLIAGNRKTIEDGGLLPKLGAVVSRAVVSSIVKEMFGGPQNNYDFSFDIHHTLGAIEFVARFAQFPNGPKFSIEVLHADLTSKQYPSGETYEILRRIGEVTHPDLKLNMLKIVARSAWSNQSPPSFWDLLFDYLEELLRVGIAKSGIVNSNAESCLGVIHVKFSADLNDPEKDSVSQNDIMVVAGPITSFTETLREIPYAAPLVATDRVSPKADVGHPIGSQIALPAPVGPILAGIDGVPLGSKFDELVKTYFEENTLGQDYLAEISGYYVHLRDLAGNSDEIKAALAAIAEKTIGKYKTDERGNWNSFVNLFKKKRNVVSYGLHRALGAIEFAGKLAERVTATKEDAGLCRDTTTNILSVLGAAKFKADSVYRKKMNNLIESMKRGDDKDLKKAILQLIGRSGWTGATNPNPNLLDEIAKFVEWVKGAKQGGIGARIAKINSAIGQIDALLKPRHIDLESMGTNIWDILTVEGGDWVILGKEEFPGIPNSATFDERVKEYFFVNNFGAGYLATLFRDYTRSWSQELNEGSTPRLTKRVGEILAIENLNAPNVGIHLALGEIEYLALFGHYPVSGNEAQSAVIEHDVTKNTLKFLKDSPQIKASDKSVFLQLIAKCGWTGASQKECLDLMAYYLPSETKYQEFLTPKGPKESVEQRREAAIEPKEYVTQNYREMLLCASDLLGKIKQDLKEFVLLYGLGKRGLDTGANKFLPDIMTMAAAHVAECKKNRKLKHAGRLGKLARSTG